jgi:hypothetical protein
METAPWLVMGCVGSKLTKGDTPEHCWQQHQGSRVVSHREHTPLSEGCLRHAGNTGCKSAQRHCERGQRCSLSESCRAASRDRKACEQIAGLWGAMCGMLAADASGLLHTDSFNTCVVVLGATVPA